MSSWSANPSGLDSPARSIWETPRERVTITVAALVLAVGAWGTTVTGEIYPTLPLGLGIAGTVLVVGLFHRLTTNLSIAIAIVLGAGYRVTVFLWPNSMIFMDSDTYALRSYAYLNGGIPDYLDGFYVDASAFPVFGAEAAAMTGLDVATAYVVFPLVVGVLFPLGAALIVKRVVGEGSIAPAIAAFVAAFDPASMMFSYAPIPLAMASVFVLLSFVGYFVLIDEYDTVRSKSRTGAFVLIASLSVAAGLTHKVPLAVFALYLWCTLVVGVAMRKSFVGRKGALLLFGVVAVITHWTFLTDYFARAAVILSDVLSSSVTISDPVSVNEYSRTYNPELIGRLRHVIYMPVVLATAGVAWLVVFIRHPSYRKVSSVILLLGGAAGAAFVVIPGKFVPAAPGFQRIFLYATSIIAAIIGVGVARNLQSPTVRSGVSARKLLVGTIIVSILLLQVFSAPASPDFADGPRFYLTEQEAATKQFAHEHVDEVVRMDAYYADEVIDFERASQVPSQYEIVPKPEDQPEMMASELVNGTLPEQNYRYVTHRETRVYRIDGQVIITWDVTGYLNSEYSRYYDSGPAHSYYRPTADATEVEATSEE
jgi:hypothetical protein